MLFDRAWGLDRLKTLINKISARTLYVQLDGQCMVDHNLDMSQWCMLAWHWPHHHWQCSIWWVAWTSSCMCAGNQTADTFATYSAIWQQTFQFLSTVTWFLDLFWKLPQIKTSNFRKVVRQHTEGMAESIIWVLLEIYFSFWQWKNLENPLNWQLSPWVQWIIFGTVYIQSNSIKTVHFEIPCFFLQMWTNFQNSCTDSRKVIYVYTTKISNSPAVCRYTTLWN